MALPDGLWLGAVTRADVDSAASLLVSAFYPSIISLGVDLQAFERGLVEPLVALVNATIAQSIRVSVAAAIVRRIGDERLVATSSAAYLRLPSAQDATSTSIALGVADSSGRLVGFVELTLLPRDGRMPTDNDLDANAFLRRARLSSSDVGPYLCNLAVANSMRKRGIGSALMKVCEQIAHEVWAYDRIHLHVNWEDEGTMRLYQRMGYEPLPEYDPHPWQIRFLGFPKTRYHVRPLRLPC